jgi:HAD superfamily hydrolase (TIGR01509 family)
MSATLPEPELPDTGLRPQAALFDLDGTLVDNTAFHARAFQAFRQTHGLPPESADARARFGGRRNSEIFAELFGRELDADELRRYEEEKESLYRELSRGGLRPLPGLLELLDRLDALGVPSALATSAPEANVDHSLEELGLAGRFRCIVRGDEVARGKPHPDVFLEAARRLGADPERSLAFEDAPMGVAAVQAAGARCVALSTTLSRAELQALEPPPDLVVGDYRELLATFAGLVGLAVS